MAEKGVTATLQKLLFGGGVTEDSRQKHQEPTVTNILRNLIEDVYNEYGPGKAL
jgi:hypothetical protein